MRTFFLQMFAAFWVSTIGIFLVATALNPDGQHGSLENILAFSQQDAAQVNASAIAVYQHHGCEVARRIGPEYLLANAQGHALCGQDLPPKTVALIQKSVRTNLVEEVHDGDQWVTATSVKIAPEIYVVVHRGPYVPRPWFPHLPAVALPVSLLVTFLFAFLLTIPVRALSRAFREFSSGNLSVRLPATRGRFTGLGGSDVRSLMLDFNHMADRVGELIEAQKMLVRDVSHELRSPLARLRLALEMARDESSAPLPALDRMEIETDRLNELIGQMLTLSLMESTRELSSWGDVDLKDIMESIVPNMQFEASSRNCGVTLRMPEEDIFVSGNAELLRRMIENVVRNAIRHTAPASDVEIAIDYETSAAPPRERENALYDRVVAIDIADRGPGAPEESLVKLFRAFYRTDTARNNSTGGFGIGLSIAERAAQLHHGTITASNRSGGGLLIAIRIPLLRSA